MAPALTRPDGQTLMERGASLRCARLSVEAKQDATPQAQSLLSARVPCGRVAMGRQAVRLHRFRPRRRRRSMPFSLPELPYSYDALAPYMSRETLEFHHEKHHLAYVKTGNNVMKGTPFEGKSLEEVVKGSFGKNDGLFNNAGQHYNHIHFWQWMKAGGGGDKMPCNLEKKI